MTRRRIIPGRRIKMRVLLLLNTSRSCLTGQTEHMNLPALPLSFKLQALAVGLLTTTY